MNESDSPYDQIKIDERKRISSIWIVPLIALIFGGYLAVKAYMERGITVTVHFTTASGIVPGKTEVRYKGLPAGVVKKVLLDKNLQTVSVEIEMVKLAESLLSEEAAFWLVRPQVSLSGISGLDTITSGNYVGFLPGNLNPDAGVTTEFTALEAPPPIPESAPGLHISLQAHRKGSVQLGTKIYYRQIAVGEVTSVSLDELKDGVIFNVHIKEEHADLVSNKSRFWNASGFSFKGDLSGFKLRTESLESLLVGGIAFDNIDQTVAAQSRQQRTRFILYEDYDAAKVGLPVTFVLPSGSGISEGMEIIFEGLKAGEITNYSVKPETREVIANAMIDPRAEIVLNSNTKFYLVSPKASLSGIANIETFIKGSHISLRPSMEGEPTRDFVVLPEAPPLDYDHPGLHINLLSDSAEGLGHGAPVSFKKINVGTIQQVKYSGEGGFVIAAHIIPEYAHLVNSQTRFWNTGGLRLKGSFQKFELEADSLASLISGGVSFGQIGQLNKSGVPAKNGDRFRLHKNKENALFSHTVTISFPTAKGIVPGLTSVIYNGVSVGKVRSLSVDPQLQEVTAEVGINPKFSWTLRQTTRFWLVSPAFSEEGIDALISGSYITMVPGGGKYKDKYKADLEAPLHDSSAPGLQFVIQSESAGSISPRSSIFYKQIKVGEIQDVRLNKSRGGVDIYAHVDKEYEDLVKKGSRFYQVSGVSVQADLVGGVKLQVESLASLISGGIAFYNPPGTDQEPLAKDRSIFNLYKGLQAANDVGVNIRIRFSDATGLRKHMPIKYQDQKIGEVVDIEFNEDFDSVTAFANLELKAAPYAMSGSKIWLVEPQVGLVEIRNVQTIITGNYLELLPGKGKTTYEFAGLSRPPVVTRLRKGLNLVLTSRRLGSVKVGDEVNYRQIKVGEIIGHDLAPDANGVRIYANIYAGYQELVRNDSVFWNTSGIRVEAGLFSGVNIDTESVESILSGGIAFATPAATRGQRVAGQGEHFQLFDEANDEWLVWEPSIRLGDDPAKMH